ncbi:hypothetical protein [Dongia sp. agr-C8]
MWQILEYIAWALSAIMLLWMVADAWKVGTQYSEEQLLSSKEGVDELFAAEQKRGH